MRAGVTRALAICGIIQPVLFIAFLIVESLLRPGYSQVSDYISDLGVGPYAILQNINFMASGLLFTAFAIGLRSRLDGTQKASQVGPALLVVGGATVFLAGVFPAGSAHQVASVVGFVASIPAPFVIREAQSADRKWGRFPSFSGVIGVLYVLSPLALVFVASGQGGLFQRVPIAITFLWTVGTATKLFTLSSIRDWIGPAHQEVLPEKTALNNAKRSGNHSTEVPVLHQIPILSKLESFLHAKINR